MIHIDTIDPRLLEKAVALHREQLATGFITSLGERFLREVFRNVAVSRYGVALVATGRDPGTVSGYLLGSTNVSGLYRDFLRRHAVRATFFALPHVTKPSTLRKIWETLRYPATGISADLPAGELLDLAVDEESRGSGLAQELFHRFAAEMAARGSPSFRITTGSSLTRAHRFYERLGARLVGEIEVHRGETTLVYVYEPAGAAEPSERLDG